jgi:hypothetical protein
MNCREPRQLSGLRLHVEPDPQAGNQGNHDHCRREWKYGRAHGFGFCGIAYDYRIGGDPLQLEPDVTDIAKTALWVPGQAAPENLA